VYSDDKFIYKRKVQILYDNVLFEWEILIKNETSKILNYRFFILPKK